MVVVKRDGREVDFDPEKIFNAISRANKEVPEKAQLYELAVRNITNIIAADCAQYDKLGVEDIQEIVENHLMGYGALDVAKCYIRYRYLHKLARNQYEDLMGAVAQKLSGENIENQNANLDEHSFGGRMGEATRLITKKFALDYCMSDMARQNHLNNEIYIHDLDSYAVGEHNCLSVPFDKLLANGFNTRQTDVRPANSVNTAFQLVAVIFQLQSLQQFGGVSATHLDWTMVPYVRKSFTKHLGNGLIYIEKKSEYKTKRFHKWLKNDPAHPDGTIHFDDEEFKRQHPEVWEYAMDLTRSEVKQAVEGMYHNLNTLQSRSGNQLPFTSINYGTCTLPEGRMVIEELLEVSIEGLGRLHKTSIFPCGIFQLASGINRKPGDPNYDLFRLALKSTALRLYPNYANVDWSGNAGYNPEDPKTIFSTMGCRTANGWDINGLEQQKDGRGNICPVTVILPTLAMEAEELCNAFTEENQPNVVDMFMELLDKKLFEARDMLKERYHWICQQNPDSAKFMYENGLMEGFDGESVESAMKHGTLAIGMLGMAEALQILISCDHTDPKGMEVAKQICQLYKDRCAQFKEEERLNFGVYYSPAENLCYTAMKQFKAKYGEIPNVSDKDFFTNSIHVPVWIEVNPFKKIDIESQLTGYSSAGCITYVELDSTVKNNLDALETLVNYAMDHDVPYFAVNVPNDTCMACGYTDELGDTCPMCGGRDIQRLRRVTGYLTGDYKTAFNLGKQQEVELRVKHNRATHR